MADNSQVLNDLSKEYRASQVSDKAPIRPAAPEAPIAPAQAPVAQHPAADRPASKRLPKTAE